MDNQNYIYSIAAPAFNEEDNIEIMPFMEFELEQRVSVNFKSETDEIIDFKVTELSTNILNYGVYF